MGADSRCRTVFAWANKVLDLAYVGLAFVAVSSVAQRIANLTGGLVLVVLVLTSALGHFPCKRWAIKSSGAAFAVVALLAVPYLFSTYEQDLVPALPVRVSGFVLLLLLALAMSVNYLLYSRLGVESWCSTTDSPDLLGKSAPAMRGQAVRSVCCLGET
jgi:hypothetical protein